MTFPPLSIWGFPKIGLLHFIIHFDGIFPKTIQLIGMVPIGQLAMIFRHLCGGGRHRGGGGGRRHRGGWGAGGGRAGGGGAGAGRLGCGDDQSIEFLTVEWVSNGCVMGFHGI